MKDCNNRCVETGRLGSRHGDKVGFIIAPGTVTTDKIANRAITPEKLSGDVLSKVFYPLVETTRRDLQTQINSFKTNGIALSDKFGTNSCIGMTQKSLSEAFVWLCGEISKSLGYNILEVQFEVSPHSSADLQTDITVTLVPPVGYIERVCLYINDTLVDTECHAEHYSFITTIFKTSNVKVEFDYFGRRYTKQRVVQMGKNLAESWAYVGSGEVFLDVYKHRENLLSYENFINLQQVTVTNWGDRIILVLDKDIHQEIEAINMSGFEIPFDIDETVLEDQVVYTSKNTYQDGTWPIEIIMNKT